MVTCCILPQFPNFLKLKYFSVHFYDVSDTDLLMTHIKNETREGIEVSYEITLNKLLLFFSFKMYLIHFTFSFPSF